MKVRLLIIILIFAGCRLSAQKTTDFSVVDRQMLQIPDSSARTVESIARYVNSKFTNEEDKIRAIFYWVAKNVKYDIENMYAVNFYENEDQIVEKAMKNRKGICMHYATLFSAISNKAGIKAFVVDGFTKQNGIVDYVPHAWNAAFVDSKWKLYDPTWASGYNLNGKFVSKLNNQYYDIKPETHIKSHIPFDPIWQLLNYTVNNSEFYQGKTEINKKKPFFNFNDSIAKQQSLTEIKKLRAANKRLESNGISNSLLHDRHQYNLRQIEYLTNKEYADKYNKDAGLLSTASAKYNEGINSLNEFINYRNLQFTPTKPDPVIKLMLQNVDESLRASKDLLEKIVLPDINLQQSITQLNRSIDEAYKNLDGHKAFLNKYLSTGKLLRKSLFYKYSVMGIPVN